MAEKVEKLGVNRDKDFMYYVKDGAVWRVQRKQPGVSKGRPEKVADGTFQMDTDFIYFVDKDGDVSRAKRAVGGQKRKKTGSQAKGKSAKKKAGGSKGKGKGQAAAKGKSAKAKSSKAAPKGKAKKAPAAKGKTGKAKKGAAKASGAKKTGTKSGTKSGKKRR
ncbi:MAG: hypothetical protein H7X95_12355 [Deltaproteobacteria bacterium]|nr:hypothetical protein [Deltaproteobacteria bacterium]